MFYPVASNSGANDRGRFGADPHERYSLENKTMGQAKNRGSFQDRVEAAKANIEKQAETKRKELQKQQDELKKIEDSLQAESSVLSEEAKAQKHRDFGTKVQNFMCSI